VGGVKDIIADNKTCFVIDNRNPSEFADKIKSILSNGNYSSEEFIYSSSNASVAINKILNE
jgi:glycosyltransferase involved in cell wall biosynthesis